MKYLGAYPVDLQARARRLVDEGLMGDMPLRKYGTAHTVRTDRALFGYVQGIKAEFLRSAEPLNKVCFDSKLHVIRNALGTRIRVSRMQGNRLKPKRMIRIASLFKSVLFEFLHMMVVHELTHMKEQPHGMAFYKLCNHMQPDYHQVEFDLRVHLTLLETAGAIAWPNS